MLHHILINLLGNAAKFSKPGSPITVQARRLPDQMVLSVLDEGPGLPIGRETSLFDRFTRVDGDDMSGGTGLGLAIVKGFADAMGLTATASNRDPAGAAFSITWPEASIRRIAE
jgi:two-component system sensor histidine kinase KdpD